jgi:hypothetical protein
VLVALASVSVARAHAPLSRGLALAKSGGAAAVRMPGFGWIVRDDEQQAFAYACDALVGVTPDESALPMVYRADGALLVGTAGGLRMLTRDGCPLPIAASDLHLPIAALAEHAGEVVYAASAGSEAALYQSDDGGQHFVLRTRLDASEPVSALLVRGDDANAIYMSQTRADMQSVLSLSEDGGVSLRRVEQARQLTLLHVAPSPALRLWASSRALDATGNRGVDILRADAAEGPWLSVLRVNFFGGFTVDADGVIWVGDEGGGVYRSVVDGDHFEAVQPNMAVACLLQGQDALWACTPGTPKKRAIAKSSAGSDPFSDVVAFADVDHLVACADTDVNASCAPAWHEWQLDVRMLATTASDAGVMPLDASAGTSTSTTAASDSSAADAAPAPVHTAKAPDSTAKAHDSAGCDVGAGVTPGRRPLHVAAYWLLGLVLVRYPRRRR